ncbi:hypothetical protein NitYY0918_C1418 [Nitratiruptor sp. YY09-18]|nr:hypothetical protein NitYY0918_C1418 [Nitratiruptor sp. YY09-18]
MQLAKILHKNSRKSDITINEIEQIVLLYRRIYCRLYNKSDDSDIFCKEVMKNLAKMCETKEKRI